MDREQIKKALECCGNPGSPKCEECPMEEGRGCAVRLYREAHKCILDLEREAGSLENRLCHLLESDTIAEYDEVDVRTKEYVRDIQKLDANLKEREYKINKKSVDEYFKLDTVLPLETLDYESPIKLLTENYAKFVVDRADKNIMKAIHNIGVEVDKEELKKALDYDREQYVTGYCNGYNRGASEVAEEIFAEMEKTLNRKIARSKPCFEKLKNRDEDFLSKWGYEDMGYFKGVIYTCEDFQDIIAELKKKYTERRT